MIFSRAFIAALAIAAGQANAAPGESPVVDQAAAAIKEGQYVRAEDLLTPLINGGRPDAAVLYNFAIVRVAQKRYEDAVNLAERATKADPTKAEYFSQLGHACELRLTELGPMDATTMAGKVKKAYEKSLKLDSENLPALLGLVRFYEHAPPIAGGDLKKAREFAERVRVRDPYQGEIDLGRLAAGAKNYDEALAHFDAAVKLKPDDFTTATASGWTLFNLGRKAEARARFEAALKIDPNFVPAKLGMAETATPAH